MLHCYILVILSSSGKSLLHLAIMLVAVQQFMVLFTAFGLVSTSRDGIVLQISQTGLNYAANLAIDALMENSVNKNLGSKSGREGDIQYEFKNIKITEFTKQAMSVDLQPGSSLILWSLANVRIICSADWSYNYRRNKFIKISDSGGLTLTANDVSVAVTMGFGFDSSSGRPTLQTSYCTSRISGLDVRFHGRNSRVYQFITGFVEEPIRNILQDELCISARRAIDQSGNEELSSLELEARLGYGLYLDYKLTSVPQIKADHIESSHVGTVFGGSVPRGPLLSEQPEMSVGSSNKMISVFMSEDSFNSYANTLFQSNILKKLITRNDLQDSVKSYLDTNCEVFSCFVGMLPEVSISYPNSSIELEYSVVEAPKVNIIDGRLSSNVSARAQIYIRLSDGSTVDLFTIRLYTALNMTARVEGGFLKFKILNFNPHIIIEGIQSSDVLERGILYATKFTGRVVTKRVNEVGEEGIPLLKTKDLRWENSELVFKDRFLHLSSDVRYVKQ